MRFRATVENPEYKKALVQSRGAVALDELKLPLATIAQVAGVSEMSCSRWIRGRLTPSHTAQDLLEAAYGIPPESWYWNAYTTDELRQKQRQLVVAPISDTSLALPTAPLEGPPPGEVDLPDLTDAELAALDAADGFTDAEALEADLAFTAELELQGEHDIAAKLLANCLVDYADVADNAPEPATVAPAPQLPAKPPRASKGRPTHPWVRKCMAAEVQSKGYEQALADWQKRSGGYADEFIEPEATQRG